ncbi:SWI2/SNF2-containing protein RAD26 [Toxoplasma gondii ME49]|uniref:SWI2/SNF2-containing protein RAD26 n=2 Tax=Toxoplasma gondii TaxID=5811 RepID=S8F842_TOXGM|nr:SWI2/SNF2-containing protein RAD26 [Toxoplasma gondii ME49]EPT29708.1 SWI2/SNF2-containing protein RAD26 [Toxoplasma gondii ME49]KYF40749.1 SWI2/SNF2-containing protein RAD26 [Toxoplasma gondii ARI]|eukprot:XP_018637150.1 SWI2/SNF2-containing protein RAD26 [Toxoplasma gondii ME49]
MAPANDTSASKQSDSLDSGRTTSAVDAVHESREADRGSAEAASLSGLSSERRFPSTWSSPQDGPDLGGDASSSHASCVVGGFSKQHDSYSGPSPNSEECQNANIHAVDGSSGGREGGALRLSTLGEDVFPQAKDPAGSDLSKDRNNCSLGAPCSALESLANEAGSGLDSSLSSSFLQRLGVRAVSASAVEERVQEELQQQEETLKKQRQRHRSSASSSSSSSSTALPSCQEAAGRSKAPSVRQPPSGGLRPSEKQAFFGDEKGGTEGQSATRSPGYGVEDHSGTGFDALVRGFASRLDPAVGEKETRERGGATNAEQAFSRKHEFSARQTRAADALRLTTQDSGSEGRFREASRHEDQQSCRAPEEDEQEKDREHPGALHRFPSPERPDEGGLHGVGREKERMVFLRGEDDEEDEEDGDEEELEEDECWTPEMQRTKQYRGGKKSRADLQASETPSLPPTGRADLKRKRGKISELSPSSEAAVRSVPPSRSRHVSPATGDGAVKRHLDVRKARKEAGTNDTSRRQRTTSPDLSSEEESAYSPEEMPSSASSVSSDGECKSSRSARGDTVASRSPSEARLCDPPRQRLPSHTPPSQASSGRLDKTSVDDSSLTVYRRRVTLFEKNARQSSDSAFGEEVLVSAEADERREQGEGDEGRGEASSESPQTFLRVPKFIWENLYPHQQTGVRWLWQLLKQGVGGIVGDEMGLGKTIQAVAFLAALHHSGVLQDLWEFQRQAVARAAMSSMPRGAAAAGSSRLLRKKGGDGGVLVVCPATVLHQWAKEFHLWYPPLRVCVFHQKSIDRLEEAARAAEESNGILLTTYETFRMHLRLLLRYVWKMAILDEGQKIRNPHAAITLAVKQLPTPHRLILSATPIQNNLQEFWSLLDFAAPGRLGTLPVFLEQIAEPITMGGYANASRESVEAAYRCACLLRKVALPLILRRSKKEMQEFLRLPNKAEEVLLCNMTAEQYALYVDFLAVQKARFSRHHYHPNDAFSSPFEASEETLEKRDRCRMLFTLSVLRKIANHPDLLLVHNEVRPEDYGNPERSGKLIVLREVLRVWKAEGRRVLLFAQTVQMLDILQRFLETCDPSVPSSSSSAPSSTLGGKKGFSFLRLDGGVPVASRHAIVDSFQRDSSIFALLLTTRVGGVGLNLTAADRVVIFDPDWNPMTDMQARERSWRIGQSKDVCIYRLLTSGSVEEKVYHRQVFKFFLSQKVLQDPRQRKFFKRNDLQEMLEPPPPPPGYSASSAPGVGACVSSKYRDWLRGGIRWERRAAEKAFKGGRSEETVETGTRKVWGDQPEVEDETWQAFQRAAAEAGTDGNLGEELARENNLILKTLLDAQGIKTSLTQDDLERPLLDASIVDRQSRDIAKAAMQALRNSQLERMSHGIDVPTWTGKCGRAGIPAAAARRSNASRSASSSTSASLCSLSSPSSGVAASILAGLRKLQRSLRASREPSLDSRAASLSQDRDDRGSKSREGARTGERDETVSLTFEEKKLAEEILHFFLSRPESDFAVTTGELLEAFAPRIPSMQREKTSSDKTFGEEITTGMKDERRARRGRKGGREELTEQHLERQCVESRGTTRA